MADSFELNSNQSSFHRTGGPETTLQADFAEMPEGRQEFSLPPADKGKDAWLFLAASFFLEALVWGFPYSFGVFQDYYQTHAPFAESSGIATIGTCAMGIMYFGFPLVIALLRLYPNAFRWAPAGGLLGMSIALVLSSFSQTVTHLILTQGILYAIVGSLSYCPCMIWVEQWFVRRRGLAFGIMWSGTGTGGFVIPLVLQSLLESHGFRTTLRIWAIALAIPAVYLIKARMPPLQQTNARATMHSTGFIFTRTFMLYQTANVVESLGYFLPAIYLPTFARSMLDAKPFLAALTVILINVSNAIGVMVVGYLTDRWHVTTCILISTAGAVLGTLFLWGFATNLATLYTFCVIYGLFAGSYVGTWPGITRQVTSTSSAGESIGSGHVFDPIMVLAFLTAGRGIGNIISGPLSEALLKAAPIGARGSRTWRGEYGAVIIFTGSTALVGGASFLWRRLGWIR